LFSLNAAPPISLVVKKDTRSVDAGLLNISLIIFCTVSNYVSFNEILSVIFYRTFLTREIIYGIIGFILSLLCTPQGAIRMA